MGVGTINNGLETTSIYIYIYIKKDRSPSHFSFILVNERFERIWEEKSSEKKVKDF